MSKSGILLACACLISAGTLQANVIVNGGFEEPLVGPTSGFITIADGSASDNSAPFVWDVTAGSVDVVVQGGGGLTGLPFEGDQFLDLVGTGFGADGALAQTFATSAGTTYELSFAYSRNLFIIPPGGTATADISVAGISGSLLADSISHSTGTTADFDWQLYTATFTALDGSTTLSFLDTGGVANGGIFLDAVSVRAQSVPLPATLALLMVGAALVGARRP